MKIPSLTLEEANKLFEEQKLIGLFMMTNEDYHSAAGLSKSSLDNLAKGPEYFRYKLENPEDLSAALIIGSAYHNIIMNDEPFDSLFYITKTQPQKPTRDAQGRVPLSEANHSLCLSMREAFLKDPKNAMLLENAIFELSYFWIDEETGVQMKGKDDIFIPEKRLIIDLKTIADLDKIFWAVKDRRYHVKAAISLDGLGEAMRQSGIDYGFKNPDTFGIAFQEKSAPFRVRRRKFEPNSLVLGEKLYKENLATYVKCVETSSWIDEDLLFTDMAAHGALQQWED